MSKQHRKKGILERKAQKLGIDWEFIHSSQKWCCWTSYTSNMPRCPQADTSSCYCDVRKGKLAWKDAGCFLIAVAANSFHISFSFTKAAKNKEWKQCLCQRQNVCLQTFCSILLVLRESFVWHQFLHCRFSLSPSGVREVVFYTLMSKQLCPASMQACARTHTDAHTHTNTTTHTRLRKLLLGYLLRLTVISWRLTLITTSLRVTFT